MKKKVIIFGIGIVLLVGVTIAVSVFVIHSSHELHQLKKA